MAKLTLDQAEIAPAIIEALRQPSVREALRDALRADEASVLPAFLTIAEFAERHRVSLRTVRTWLHDGMPCSRVRRVVRIVPDEADAWLRDGGRDRGLLERARRDAARARARGSVA